MKIIFLDEALSELEDAIQYYETQQSKLGLQLLKEINRHISWIQENYKIPRLRKGKYRRINLEIFPYNIPYIIREKHIWIIAIAHNHRRPEYWINRNKRISH